MPDTGSPWNIPYVENADLVRDWPADSLLVANAVAAGLSAAGNAGIGSNVVAGESTATFTTTSGTFVDVTSVTATITPTSATAKVLVLFSATTYGEVPSAGGTGQFQLLRGATVIWDSGNMNTYSGSAINVLDSPASGSATIYKLQARDIGGGTAHVVEARTHVIEVAA